MINHFNRPFLMLKTGTWLIGDDWKLITHRIRQIRPISYVRVNMTTVNDLSGNTYMHGLDGCVYNSSFYVKRDP